MTEKKIIGREYEIKILKELLESNEAEFLAIYGRRRVGKTHLIREFFSGKGEYFEITGQKDGKMQDQLENFIVKFSEQFHKGFTLQTPKNWKEAFGLVNKQAQLIPKNKKFIFFIDELPWLASRKSNLLQALDYYWNSYWSKNEKFILVTCGSAASWMIDHLINAKGGLYNRLTKSILLKPYNLKETKEFLKSRGLNFNNHQVLELFMVFGGIPHYLKQAVKGKSSSQIVDDVCFNEQGLLYDEFDRLFESLFEHHEIHEKIVKAIADQHQGISRDQLIEKTKLSSGGTLNKRLKELEASNFISSYVPLGKKRKDHYYRISDEYTLFYLKWVEKHTYRGVKIVKNYWKNQVKSPKVNSWKGYAFENVCLSHVEQIRLALDLSNIHCDIGSWRYLPPRGSKEKGAQIDLIFDRKDDVITLCEIKYSDHLLTVDKEISKQLADKVNVFEKHFASNKQIFVAMITTKGIKQTIWSNEIVQNEVVLDDLFRF